VKLELDEHDAALVLRLLHDEFRATSAATAHTGEPGAGTTDGAAESGVLPSATAAGLAERRARILALVTRLADALLAGGAGSDPGHADVAQRP